MYEDTKTTAIMDEQQTAGFLHVVPMTFEEKVAMYMKCSKLELAKMLAERDRLGLDYVPCHVPCPYQYQQYPPVDPNQYEIICEGNATSVRCVERGKQ